MSPSKVYYTDLHTTFQEGLLEKLRRLIKAAGIDSLDVKNKYTAIKIHFGEPGNLAYLRPNFSKVVADVVRENGGSVFLTDCNTLYVGRRTNAIDHLNSAYENGYNPFTTGCQIIIGDGLKGTDEVLVPIEGTYVKEAKIGRGVMDADIIISVTHFKAHEATGIGGALKNIGMGCGSRAGKEEMHCSGKPYVDVDHCTSCGACANNCAHSAISFPHGAAFIETSLCVGCGRCISICPSHAVIPSEKNAFYLLNARIAEYSHAVLKEKQHFHISFLMDVSPYCDCHAENDVPIIPDVGIFASFDPVALDQACADIANKQPPIQGSKLTQMPRKTDHFATIHPGTDWQAGIDHAVSLGIGTKEYELIEI